MPAHHRQGRTPYGRHHDLMRSALIEAALGTECPGAYTVRPDGTVTYFRSPRCLGVMTDTTLMHLDHSVPVVLGGVSGDRIVCMPCNTGAGARLGNELRKRSRARVLPQW